MRDAGPPVSLAGLLQSVAIVTIVVSVLTALDLPHRAIELFSHFRLQYFAVTLLLLIAFSVQRNLPYAAALLLTALINGMLVVHWYLPVNRSATGSVDLKILHANVHSSSDQYARVAELVSREQPELVFLQEITGEWVAALQALLIEYPYSYAEPRTGNFGIAVFSKIPFDSVTHVDSPPLSYPTIIASLTIEDESIEIISTHPTIPLGRSLYNARNEQISSIAGLVNNLPGNVVLLGDFNESMWGPQYRKLLQSTGLDDARKGFGVVPTWPTFFPPAMIPIDHVFISAGIGVAEFRAGRRIGSDHLPLVVTLNL